MEEEEEEKKKKKKKRHDMAQPNGKVTRIGKVGLPRLLRLLRWMLRLLRWMQRWMALDWRGGRCGACASVRA